jgi:Ca2+/Na+ antiporter
MISVPLSSHNIQDMSIFRLFGVFLIALIVSLSLDTAIKNKFMEKQSNKSFQKQSPIIFILVLAFLVVLLPGAYHNKVLTPKDWEFWALIVLSLFTVIYAIFVYFKSPKNTRK